mmetsp:Transcript_3917/g.5666  ORF Transcript_3917/g.5666 Transcript_3917/m.5666 type:complete len:146 (+) Transcript_3917:39-476(+)
MDTGLKRIRTADFLFGVFVQEMKEDVVLHPLVWIKELIKIVNWNQHQLQVQRNVLPRLQLQQLTITAALQTYVTVLTRLILEIGVIRTKVNVQVVLAIGSKRVITVEFHCGVLVQIMKKVAVTQPYVWIKDHTNSVWSYDEQTPF